MEKDKGGNGNVIDLRFVRASYCLPDGSSVMTDKLDPVLFAEYLKQKKLLDELIVANSNWKTQYVVLEGQLKRWRWTAYLGMIAVWGALLIPSMVRVFFRV